MKVDTKTLLLHTITISLLIVIQATCTIYFIKMFNALSIVIDDKEKETKAYAEDLKNLKKEYDGF
jgi:hypothetical protein